MERVKKGSAQGRDGSKSAVMVEGTMENGRRGEESVEGTQGRMTEGRGLMFSLPLSSLMEAVLSKLCWFIKGLVSDNFELSVIEIHPSHLHVQTHTDK